MKEDITWFKDMLEALIEVACPNSILTKEAAQFLYDMEKGIKKILKNITQMFQSLPISPSSSL